MTEILSKVSVSEDDTTYGGFAFIDLGRKTSHSSILLSFRRLNAEPRHLGEEGWQPEVCWIRPDRVDQSGHSTVVRVGPAVVDQISELDPIEITVRGDHDALPIVHWPALTPSAAPLAQVGLYGPEQKAAPSIEVSVPDRENGLEDHRLDVLAGVLDETNPVAKEQEFPSNETVDKLAPLIPNEAAGLAQSGSAQKQKPGRTFQIEVVVYAVLIAIGIGTAVYWKWGWPKAEPPDSNPPTAQTPAAPAAVPERQLESRLKDLITRAAPAADFEKIGQEALSHGYGRIAFRAFEEADPGQSQEASWQLARFYDPRVTDQVHRNVAQPNFRRAIYYYSMGAAAGSDRHRKELRVLCTEHAGEITGDDRVQQQCHR
jgi:hypothetical protein